MTLKARSSAPALVWVAVALITLGAVVLRLVHIGRVAPDPFYDAAVRSMELSWHNFFFGAFDPSGSTSIDKPPVDLWLQVASVKLLGFSTTTLKLPEAFAGILSVPLLFAAVRRMWSTTAGIAAAVALAVLPVEVITSRSDTMDGVMMALIVLALWLIVRACETGRCARLLAGAATLGIAFDVKLLESLVALPGLALLAYLGLPGPRKRRLLRMLAAGAVYVAVALAWLTATLLVPAHDRPYAIGSTNGSTWNAAFVFNGSDRLGGKSPEPRADRSTNPGTTTPWRRRPSATTSRSCPPPHAPAGEDRAAVGRAAGPGAARRAAAGRSGVDQRGAGGRRAAGQASEQESDDAEQASVYQGRRIRRRGGGPVAVDAHGDRAVQRHDPAAPALRRGLHAGGGRTARHRCGVGRVDRRSGLDREPRASGRADRGARGERVLRRAAAVRASRACGQYPWRARSGRSRSRRSHA